MTADGVVVVSHDPALNPAITRDAAGHWLNGPGPLICQLTFDELRLYDVGRIRPTTPYRLQHRAQKGSDGARVPTLAEVLGLSSDARFIIELKTDPGHPDWTADPGVLADAVLVIVDAAGTAERVVLESFDWRGPRHVRRVRPDIRLAWLTREETAHDAALWRRSTTPLPEAVAAEGGQIWAPAFGTVTRALVAEAHELGLRVIPWTVNRRVVMRRLIGFGVDGLITDRPDVALEETHSLML
jgi:glycerophosphoryl diester phosphodiesterase